MNETPEYQFETIIANLQSDDWRIRNPTLRNLDILSEPRFFDTLVKALNSTDFLARHSYLFYETP